MDASLPERRQHHTWRWRLLSAWIVVFSAVVILGIVQIRNQQSDIQSQRREAILRTCQDQNARHDGTLRELDVLLKTAELGASKARLIQLRTSRVSTTLLINALAPKRDCTKLVYSSVHGP